MKTDLQDVTFLILIRLDSIHRLENIIAITNHICHYFNTNIVVLEAADHNNSILKVMLNKRVQYLFIEDKDPILYKTKYLNRMTKDIVTPYLAIWDADIVVDKKAIIEAVTKLRNKEADITFPYNGICMDVPEIIRTLFLKKNDIRILYRHKSKMNQLYPHMLVGGAVIADREKYIQGGMENEIYYGWGNDDFDRYYRFIGLGYKILRVNNFLFHLSHPRGNNSQFRSKISAQLSSSARFTSESSSKEEIICSLYYETNNTSLL